MFIELKKFKIRFYLIWWLNLVIKILALAGVLVKDPNVYQVAATEENKDVQQEKS